MKRETIAAIVLITEIATHIIEIVLEDHPDILIQAILKTRKG